MRTQDCHSESFLASRKLIIPHNFEIKPRALKDIMHWIATECQLYLLYIRLFVLKNMGNSHVYHRILAFHISMHIFSTEERWLFNYAKKSLFYFVKNCILLYGKESVSYSVHGLTHLAVLFTSSTQ